MNMMKTELLLSIFSQGLYRFHKKTGELQEYIVADAEKSRRLFRLGLAVHLGLRMMQVFIFIPIVLFV